MYVREHMSAPPVTVAATTSAAAAKRILDEKRFRHLPVVDGNGLLVGIVSDRDLRSLWPSGLDEAGAGAKLLARLEETPLEACMTRDPHYLTPGSTLDDALYVMEKMKFGALPVVDDGRKVVGIFAVPDLMKAYRHLFGLGEEGTAFLEVRDDGSEDLPGRIFAVLAAAGVPLVRYVRKAAGAEGESSIYLRLATYNIHGLKEELKKNGIACRDGSAGAQGRDHG
jgi:acetoin utilization protein AcuB